MSVSIFDIFKVEIGPFGSHAVGPMIAACHSNVPRVDEHPMPYSFRSAEELLRMCKASGRTIADLMLENEKCWRSTYDIRAGLLAIAAAMEACIARGGSIGGSFPGPREVRRLTADRNQQLSERAEDESLCGPLRVERAIRYARALNEENTRDGRIVAAPPNGAGGIIPAVLQYYRKFVPGANEDGVVDFLLTAAAIGIIHRKNASIFGGEADGQREVGAACSMAAAGLAAVLGGSNEQIENAVEIGSKHNLGISCDPPAEHGRRLCRGAALSAA
ncbi:L-serine ammonia-lyase, iron-sulfur-dependent, subunit alpha [Cupriavidus necator]|uniref:L-serine ammonia-lyase, iron-sulfur-dependent, subunit alpha n=1 Tax=Cupriavidus necator TaxID=106590 RepID=UPI0027885FD9|nr:L-serine ammonia-lyase, iron-sulfur-dependent, subunit alpha [Cupriavidus necator]MDQ0142008.1 L-serine dehydratase [Cupriavidus necator]